MKQDAETEMLKEYAEQEYKYGFVTDIESETLPPGLNEGVIRFISVSYTHLTLPTKRIV